MDQVKIYIDAGYNVDKKRKPIAPIFVACVIEDKAGPMHFEELIDNKPLSSCHAEYYGLEFVLKRLIIYKYGRVMIFNDNQTLVRQMQNKYGVHKPELKAIKARCDRRWELATAKGNILSIHHIRRFRNKADKHVQALKKESKA